MTSDNSQWVKKAAIAAAVGAGAAGLIYLATKKFSGSSNEVNAANEKTVEHLKQLGNKLFSARKYDEAIDAFSKAIALTEEGSEILKAQCYQNRAAAKDRLGSFSTSDMMSDCVNALKLNPGYGKAYWRKARLHEKNKEYHNSIVDTFCAMNLDSTFDKQAGGILPLLLEEMEKIQHTRWNATHIKGQPKAVRHEKVYTWLRKTVVIDVLRNEVINWKGSPSTSYETALQDIKDQKYDRVCEICESVEGDKLPEALLLAARFYAYQNLNEKALSVLSQFDSVLSSDEFAEKRASLAASKQILLIEMENTKDALMKAYYSAIATDLRNVDFYAMTAFRLVLCGEAHEAMKILSTESIDSNDNIKLLRFTLAILANTDGNMDSATLHRAILNLETFVNGMESKSAYSQCLLAKVYATFGQDTTAREIMDGVVKAEPNVSIHYFDRSCMAQDGEEAISLLEKCLELEPNHTEAILMCASLKLNTLDTKLIKRSDYDLLTGYVDRAQATFEGNIDFPVIAGIFRLREVLDAKRDAAIQLGSFQ